MSRFWAANESSSDDSSSDDSSVSSSSSEDQKGRVGGTNRWLDFSDDSDSEEEVRVVKSAKTRTFESLQESIKTIRNAIRINDYAKIQNNFDILMKTVSTSKTKAIIDAHGGLPRFFIRLLCDLEDFILKRKKDKGSFKKLSATQGRALNRMGLSLKKNNKTYEKLMKEYRANPSTSDDEASVHNAESSVQSDEDSSSSASESDSENDNDSDSDSEDSSQSDSDSDIDSDSNSSSSDSSSSSSGSVDVKSEADSDWGSSSSSSEESESDAEEGAYSQLKGRARWLKNNTVVKEKVVKDKEGRSKARAEAKIAAAAAKVEAAVTEEKMKEKEEELTAAVLERKCKEFVISRGKRGTDTKEVLKNLERLAQLAVKYGPRVEIPILMHVITAQFDLVRTLDDYMETPAWKSCALYLERVSGVLEDGDDNSKKCILVPLSTDEDEVMIGNALGKRSSKIKDAALISDMGALGAVSAEVNLVNPHTGEVESEDERAERLRVEKEARMTEEELRNIPVVGSLSLFMSRLDQEYIKSLQRTSPYSGDYIIRLRDEDQLIVLLQTVYQYFVRVDSKPEASEMCLRIVEHLYCRHDSLTRDRNTINLDSSQLISELCTYVYQHGDDRSKTRAMLCHIYHHALHDRFLDARDLLLMSHLQDNIANVGDISTMIIFNRMMVTLGLGAFRAGRIWDAHQCLSDVCAGRVRELLAQGVSTHHRYGEQKSPEDEKAEKRRQIPYHQHINLELLEACHLISAMLLEVPNMAAARGDASIARKRVISRTFRKHNDIYDRQVFTGPPEQIRDYIMCATKALMKGDWKKCSTLLASLEVWALVPGDDAAEQIEKMLVEKIKLEGLRTYLYTYSSQYDSLSLQQLCSMFDLSKNEVHSIVSKMMINRELHASWDQPTDTIVLRKVEATALQSLALQFAEKTANLVESNERLLDTKSGNFAFRDHDWKHGGDQQRFGYSHRRTSNNGGGRGQFYRGGPRRGGRAGGRGGRGKVRQKR